MNIQIQITIYSQNIVLESDIPSRTLINKHNILRQNNQSRQTRPSEM